MKILDLECCTSTVVPTKIFQLKVWSRLFIALTVGPVLVKTLQK